MNDTTNDRDAAAIGISLMSRTQLMSILHVGASRAYRGAHFTPQTYRTIAHTMCVLHLEREIPDWIDEWRSPSVSERAYFSPSARRTSRPLVN